MLTRDEVNDILDDTERQLKAVKAELLVANGEIEWLNQKLIEAQERNRKLDWLLTRTVEELS